MSTKEMLLEEELGVIYENRSLQIASKRVTFSKTE